MNGRVVLRCGNTLHFTLHHIPDEKALIEHVVTSIGIVEMLHGRVVLIRQVLSFFFAHHIPNAKKALANVHPVTSRVCSEGHGMLF